MKQLLAIGIICLFLTPSNGQTTKALFSDCELSQVFDYYFDTTQPDKQSIRFLQETTRNGKEVLEYELIGNGAGNPNSSLVYLRIDEKKVYYYNRFYDPADPVVEEEWLFYDFAPAIGEKIAVSHINHPGFLIILTDYTVIEKSTIQLMDGVDRTRMLLELDVEPSITIEWIEGIGNANGGILRPAW